MKKGNIFKQISSYLSEIKGELRNVSWPNRNDIQKTTTAVIVLSVIIGIYLYMIDVVFQLVVQRIIGIFK